MKTRTAIVLLLLLPAAAFPQDLDTAASAVVQISGTRNGATVRGSGFVVGLDRDKATIVTVSHVIAGLENIQVTFAADLTESFPAGGFQRMDAESPKGPAVFQVRGSLPAGVTVLSFEAEKRPHLGETVYLLGFPWMATSLRTTQRTLSARDGTSLLIDQGLGEGFSGGPVLQNGKVVGVVTGVGDQTTYAVEAVVVRAALEGWEVKLAGQVLSAQTGTSVTSTPPKPAPPPAAAACVSGQSVTEDGIAYVRICPGTFIMGSSANGSDVEKPAHQVTLSEFLIGKNEITNEQYRRFDSDHRGEIGLPATYVSWTDAKATCDHFGGHLPTEAEWEYAARAGSQTAWPFGNDDTVLRDYGWYAENARGALHPVGTKKANTWGLYDTLGNAREWVADWFGPYSSVAQIDPSGPTTGEARVARGGSIDFSSYGLRSAYRQGYEPEKNRLKDVGFRCVIRQR